MNEFKEDGASLGAEILNAAVLEGRADAIVIKENIAKRLLQAGSGTDLGSIHRNFHTIMRTVETKDRPGGRCAL
jgi:hypothetical protein